MRQIAAAAAASHFLHCELSGENPLLFRSRLYSSFRLGKGARYAWAAMMSGRLFDSAYACSTMGEVSDRMTLPMDMKKLEISTHDRQLWKKW